MEFVLGMGGFQPRERVDGEDRALSDALALDDFVSLVDSLGPQKTPRMTKNDLAFARQLVRKTEA